MTTSETRESARFAVYTSREIQQVTDLEGPKESRQALYEGVPVWVVTFEGMCIPISGPPGTAPGCAGNEWNVVINADTGEYIQGFSDR